MDLLHNATNVKIGVRFPKVGPKNWLELETDLFYNNNMRWENSRPCVTFMCSAV